MFIGAASGGAKREKKMGREVRMVPPGWNHPTQYVQGLRGRELRYVPLFEGSYKDAAEEYAEAKAKWNRGEFPDYADEESRKMKYEEWAGQAPDQKDYMPEFAEGTATLLMMYENTSEGTPISPAFATPEELARWLADTGASAFGDMTATYEKWLQTCRGSWAPSMVIACGKMMSGVEASEGA